MFTVGNFITKPNDSKLRKEYAVNDGKSYNFANKINKYIISEQRVDTPDNYISILINLHSIDVINSECQLALDKHVRCITPAICGQSNFSVRADLIDAFQIAYNVSHLHHNSNASTYTKMIKIIELFNQNNPNFYDLNEGAFSRPVIDHLYLSESNDNFNEIFMIDTNHNTQIF
jgi:hypothetical protein